MRQGQSSDVDDGGDIPYWIKRGNDGQQSRRTTGFYQRGDDWDGF